MVEYVLYFELLKINAKSIHNYLIMFSIQIYIYFPHYSRQRKTNLFSLCDGFFGQDNAKLIFPVAKVLKFVIIFSFYNVKKL